jgi:hypothetical protein
MGFNSVFKVLNTLPSYIQTFDGWSVTSQRMYQCSNYMSVNNYIASLGQIRYSFVYNGRFLVFSY